MQRIEECGMLAHYWLHVVVQNSLGEIFAHCTEQFSQALKILAVDSTEQLGQDSCTLYRTGWSSPRNDGYT